MIILLLILLLNYLWCHLLWYAISQPDSKLFDKIHPFTFLSITGSLNYKSVKEDKLLFLVIESIYFIPWNTIRLICFVFFVLPNKIFHKIFDFFFLTKELSEIQKLKDRINELENK